MADPHLPKNIADYNERSLRTLVRALNQSQGEFSLILAHCNHGALRQRMVSRLRELSPLLIRELVLPASVMTLYTTILTELAEDEHPEALIVLGLESVSAIDQVLSATNHVREKFRESFSFPVVLWIDDALVYKLIRQIPDFKSWAPTSIKFALNPEGS